MQPPSAQPPVLPPDVQAAMARGDKIDAIKRLRQHWGLGLKEAKTVIDAEMARDGRGHGSSTAGVAAITAAVTAATALRGPRAHLAPGEQPPRSHSWLWVLAAALVAAGYFGFWR